MSPTVKDFIKFLQKLPGDKLLTFDDGIDLYRPILDAGGESSTDVIVELDYISSHEDELDDEDDDDLDEEIDIFDHESDAHQ